MSKPVCPENAAFETFPIHESQQGESGVQSISAAEHLTTPEFSHTKIAEVTGDLAKATRVLAGVATIGAMAAAPTGLAAVGVAIGITSAPFIVTVAPILIGVAGAAATLSAGAQLYSKYYGSDNSETQ
jgi:hypothetical protein